MKQAIGWFLLLLPFIAVTIGMIASQGFVMALIVWGTVVVTVALIAIGLNLTMGSP